MSEKSSTRITNAQPREVAIRHPASLVLSRSLREEFVPARHKGWLSHVNHRRIKALAASDKALWAVTGGGVVCWHWRDDIPIYTSYSSEHGLPGSLFSCITIDKWQRPWVGGGSVGLNYLEGMEWLRVTKQHGLPSLEIFCLTTDPNGVVWAGTAHGIGQISLREGEPSWQSANLSAAQIPSNEVRALATGSKGKICVGTSWGLYVQETADSDWQRYTMADGLLANEITSLLLTPDGRLWVGTTQGLCILEAGELRTVEQVTAAVRSIAFAPPQNSVWLVTASGIWHYKANECKPFAASMPIRSNPDGRSVAVNHHGKVYLGFNIGVVEHTATTRILSMPDDSDPPHASINTLAIDSQRRMWAGTALGLWTYERGKWQRLHPGNKLAKPVESVEHIATCPDNVVWVGSWQIGQRGGLRQFRAGVEIPFTKRGAPAFIDAMTVDSAGHLWVANGDQLQVYDGEKWGESFESPAPSALIQTIYVDKAGQLWCGTATGLYHWKNNRWYPINELKERAISALVEDGIGNLWIGTPEGLYIVAEGVLQPSNADLPSNEIRTLCLASREDLWIGTANGLARLQHDAVTSWSTFDSGLVDQNVRALALGDTSTLWIGTINGVSQLSLLAQENN